MTMRSAFLLMTATAMLVGHAVVPVSGQANDLAFCRGNDDDLIKRLVACNRFLESKSKKSPRDMAAAYNARGLILNAKGFPEKALGDYTAAIKASPKEAAFYINRSALFIAMKEYDRAIADATQAIALAPDEEAGYYNRGRAHYHKDDCRPAIPDLTESINRDPNFGGTYSLRGYCYEQIGELKKALADYDRHMALGKPSATSYNNRGTTQIKRGHFDEGVRDLTESLRLEPNNARALANRGYGYRELGERELALKDFTAAIALEPQRAGPYLERGIVLARMDRDEEAVADVKRALQLDPNYKVAQDVLPRIEQKIIDRKRVEPQPKASPDSASASAEKRVALVIGNGNYRFVGPLANPGNDATDIAKALRGLGFEVVEGRDLDRQAMNDALREFARKLDGARLAVAFYAGHGLQVDGRNYLLPVDAKIERRADLGLDAMELRSILEQMESRDRVSVVFLDACRDNPLTQNLAAVNAGGRGLGAVKVTANTQTLDADQGLAAVKGAAGTLIAYATQPDNVALDGDGRNSPFTTALLKHMATPGLEIETMMKQVRLDVIAATREKQVPWGHSSLVGNVYLKLP